MNTPSFFTYFKGDLWLKKLNQQVLQSISCLFNKSKPELKAPPLMQKHLNNFGNH